MLTVTDCTKCIHEQVCDQASRQMWSAMAKEAECSDFKDRAEYVEVQHGEWKLVLNEFSVCTECGMVRNIHTQFAWEFCPNCGAKMDGDVDAAD